MPPGKLPPRKLTHGKLPPEKCPLGKLIKTKSYVLPGKTPRRKLPL